jgi:hypothetical protein
MVALNGSADFGVSNVLPGSLRFGLGSARPYKDGAQVESKDVNGDGYTDLREKFRIYQAGIMSGDTAVCLNGLYVDGAGLSGFTSIEVKGNPREETCGENSE